MLFIISLIIDCIFLTAAFIAVFTDSDIMVFNAAIWSDKNRLRLVMFADEWNVWLFENDMFNLSFILDIFVVKNEETVKTYNFNKIEKSKEKKDF